MKVKVENLVYAIKDLVEAGEEEALAQLAKEQNMFVTANKTVVKEAKTIMLKAEHAKAHAAGTTPTPSRLARLSGESRVCEPDD